MLQTVMWVTMAFSGITTGLVAAEPPARRVRAMIESKCLRCHGEPNSFLDFGKLRASDLIDLRAPEQSTLFQRISDGSMPLGGEKLPQGDIDTVLEWLRAGAPDADPGPAVDRPFVSEESLLELVARDLRQLPRATRSSYRYFTLTGLHNGDAADADVERARQALTKALNSLSWQKKVALPAPLDALKTVLRVRLEDLGWSAATWERLLRAYPYALERGGPIAEEVYSATSTRMPLMRADWFVAHATLPPLYHDVLGLPATDLELERQLGVDVAAGISSARAVRAGFRGGDFPDGSGVSRNNRVIERHESRHGAYWKSYDFAGNSGAQNVFENPVGFRQAGGEIIFSLPNGFQAYLLVDARGRRIDFGPSDIVQDPSRKDKRVVNGASCMSCHFDGMREKKDQIVASLADGGRFDPTALRTVRALYGNDEALRAGFAEDAARFRRAMDGAGVPVGGVRDPEPVFAASERFGQPLSLRAAAAELGMKASELEPRLASEPRLAGAASQLRGAGMPRDQFDSEFTTLARVLGLGRKSPGGEDPDVIRGDPNETLIESARNGDERRVDLALRKGASPAARDELGRTALHHAAEGGFTRVVARLLLETRVPVGFADERDSRQALDLAILAGHADVVALLVADWRTSLLTRDAHGFSALALAAQARPAEGDAAAIVRLLLSSPQAAPLLNEPDSEQGFSPLHWAAFNGVPEIVEAFLATPGIVVGAKAGNGETPLVIAQRRRKETGRPIFDRVVAAIRARAP